jgi:hypothetical protein
MKMRKPDKPRVWHWGIKDGQKAETLCGKQGPENHSFAEYSHLTTDEKRVTCKRCRELLDENREKKA